jgi:molybdopterin converting factor small subunit
MAEVEIRYYAGARAAAGVAAEYRAGATLAELLTSAHADHGEALERVFTASSFLVDGVVVHDRTIELPAGCTVDVLPPFAGG